MRGTNEEQKRITCESLLSALIELWETKPYDKITVTELARKAGVSRMAFYRNYDSIDQIVVEHMRGLYQTYLDDLVRDGRTLYIDYSVRFFQYVAANERFMRKALEAGFFEVLLESIEDHISSEESWRVADVDMTKFGDKQLRRFMTGGYLVVLANWLEGGMAETPEEMGETTSAYVHTLLGPAIERKPN